MSSEKTEKTPFLKLLEQERKRLEQHDKFIESLDVHEIAKLAKIVASHLDDEIPGAGDELRRLNSKQEILDHERAALAVEGLTAAMQADEAEVDARFCDLHNKLHALNHKETELHVEFQAFRHHIAALRAQVTHQATLQEINEQSKIEQDRISDVAADLLAKVTTRLQPVPSAQEIKQPSTEFLSTVVQAYCDDQKAQSNWTKKTEAENQAIYTLWLRIVSDQPISSYGFDQHREYKSILQKLPPNLNKIPRYTSKSIKEILELGDQPAALNTVNKNLIRIAALFKWAVRHGYTSLNPAEGMVLKNPKRASEERQAFTPSDLENLFQSPEYCSGTHLYPYMHWTPLIALYTGARLNEIAQLHLADFQTLSGIHVININEEGEGKRLKTQAGKRIIPVHSELERLGLLKYVNALRDQGKTRLFPELKKGRDGYGQAVSKWFKRYRMRCGITESGKVFHSFRHTFIDQLKQKGAAKEKIAAIVGHEDESETFGRYGKQYEASAMYDVIQLLNFDAIRNIPTKL